MKGIVVKYDQGRQFGFIRPDTGGDDVFFHYNDVVDGKDRLTVGANAQFTLIKEPKGTRAQQISLQGAAMSPQMFFSIGAAGIAFFVSAMLIGYFSIDWWHAWLLGVNLAAFAMFGFDKGVAGSESTRVPESVLLTLAATGGVIGVLGGMRFFRHKTRKGSFQISLAIVLGAQLLALYLLQAKLGIPIIRLR